MKFSLIFYAFEIFTCKNVQKLERFVDWCWLLGLIFTLTIDTYKFSLDLAARKKMEGERWKVKDEKERDTLNKEISKVDEKIMLFPLKLAKSAFDVPVALSAIGKLTLNNLEKGLYGGVASLSSAILLWPKD